MPNLVLSFVIGTSMKVKINAIVDIINNEVISTNILIFKNLNINFIYIDNNTD